MVRDSMWNGKKIAVLRASDSMEDYKSIDGNVPQMTKNGVPSYVNCEYDGKPFQYFIYAKDEKNISITGTGIIDGTEELYYGEIDQYHIEGSYYPRIPMMLLENVQNLIIKNITLTRC
jgi:hypothetical protein